MSNVGRSQAGNTLIGQGVTAGPRFAAIGTDSGLTANGVLVAHGTSPFTATAAGTNGQVVVGSTGAAPAFATITSTGSTITFTPGPNTLNMEAGATVPTTITADTGSAVPAANNLNILGGPGVTTSGSGSTLTINSVVFTDQSGSGSVTSDSGSFVTGAFTMTLPASPAQGEVCEFVATSAAALVVDAPSTHLIRIGNAVSSAGGTATSGSLAGDSLTLRYRSSDTTWYATSVIGNWTTA